MRITFRDGGVAHPPSQREDISSFVIELNDGTPVVAGFEEGGTVIVAKGGDADFSKMLNTLNYHGKAPTVSVLNLSN